MTSQTNQLEFVYASADSLHHHAYITTPIFDFLSQYAPLTNNSPRVLDLGCGNGSFSHRMAAQGYAVTGVESSVSGVRMASEKYSNCTFLQASIYDLPYPDLENQFDVVVSSDVIEHLFISWRVNQSCLSLSQR